MQYKKEELKNNIIMAAEKEFNKKGFLKASLRSIAKSAGTSIGNFYNYFSDKEELFEEIVQGEYYKFQQMMHHHDHKSHENIALDDFSAKELYAFFYQSAEKVIPVFSDRFILLLDGSQGTKYENVKHEFVQEVAEHFGEHMEEADSGNKHLLAEVIANQFINGLIMIIKEEPEKDKRKILLVEYIMFYFFGIKGITAI